jgi:hypothetical protein
VNVQDYQAQLRLFDGAYKKHGRVDVAVYSAGITETAAGGWIVSAETNLESVKEVRAFFFPAWHRQKKTYIKTKKQWC